MHKGPTRRVVCLATPAVLIAGALYYPRPGDVSDDAIRRLLEQHDLAAHH